MFDHLSAYNFDRKMKMNNLSAQHVEVQNNRVRNDAKDATDRKYNKNKT